MPTTSSSPGRYSATLLPTFPNLPPSCCNRKVGGLVTATRMCSFWSGSLLPCSVIQRGTRTMSACYPSCTTFSGRESREDDLHLVFVSFRRRASALAAVRFSLHAPPRAPL